MARLYRQSTTRLGAVHFHAALSQFPTVCFILALGTDTAYWRTANPMWQNFSDWLLLAGLVVGAFAALAGIVALFRRRSADHRPYWAHGLGSVVVLLLAFLNNLVHSSDGWTAVLPWGLTLSALTVLLLLVTNYYGRLIEDRRHVLEAQEAESIPS